MSSNQLDTKSQAWSALFSEPMSELVKRYTASVFFDKRLWLADITGSLAHAEMLAAQGIIAAAAMLMLASLSLILYANVYDVFSLLGHVYKVAGYYLIYRLAFVTSVREPYDRLAVEIAEKAAALTEQERPNIFTNSVANIGPGETVLVQIEYQEPVQQSGSEFSLRVPMACW